jgi:hypothetical protein
MDVGIVFEYRGTMIRAEVGPDELRLRALSNGSPTGGSILEMMMVQRGDDLSAFLQAVATATARLAWQLWGMDDKGSHRVWRPANSHGTHRLTWFDTIF